MKTAIIIIITVFTTLFCVFSATADYCDLTQEEYEKRMEKNFSRGLELGYAQGKQEAMRITPKEQAGGDAMTQEQAKKKEWLQRCLHETQKLEAMTICGKYTENECINTEQAVKQTEHEIKHCIAALGDPELEAVLIRRYIIFQSWEQIADEMHYSVRTILRRHADALEKLSLNGTRCH